MMSIEEDVLTAVDLLTHRDGISYEDYVRNIVASGNEIVRIAALHGWAEQYILSAA